MSAANDLLSNYQNVITNLSLICGDKGIFDVEVDGTTIYSKHETWFSVKDLIPIKEISFDKNGEVFKEKIFSYSSKDGMDLVKTLTIRNIQKGTYTTLFIDSIKLNTELDENYFKEKNLKRIPK